MLPGLMLGLGAAGSKLLGSAVDDGDAAKKQALMQLHQNLANGQLSAPVQPGDSNPLADAAKSIGGSVLGGALSDKKPDDSEWYKQAARGALGSGVLGGK